MAAIATSLIGYTVKAIILQRSRTRESFAAKSSETKKRLTAHKNGSKIQPLHACSAGSGNNTEEVVK